MREKKRRAVPKKKTRVDYSVKHIRIKDGEKEYYISFRAGWRHGVRVVTLDGFSEKAKLTDAYPPITRSNRRYADAD